MMFYPDGEIFTCGYATGGIEYLRIEDILNKERIFNNGEKLRRCFDEYIKTYARCRLYDRA